MSRMQWDHQVVWREPSLTLSVREKVLSGHVGERLKEILPKAIKAAAEHATGYPFAIWHDVSGTIPDQIFDMEAGMQVFKGAVDVDGFKISHLPGGNILQITYMGSYDGLSEAYTEIVQWMRANAFEPAGPPWDSYVDDPELTGVDNCRTLICWPVRSNAYNR